MDYYQHINVIIYLSVGTQLLSEDIPAEWMSAFLQVFSELGNVKVLWKWDLDNVDHMPKNVLARKWLPQNDILAHPNVKLFITHGGLLGLQEGLHNGVPVLGIPIFGDQPANTMRAEHLGYCIQLQIHNITGQSMRWAISELLDNPTYMNMVQKYSSVFRERPQSAMETAMFWIEYVIKFNGANHLRSAGRDLTWYSYLLLDVIALVALALIVVVVVCWFAIKMILSKSRQCFKSPVENKTYKYHFIKNK